MFTKVYEHFGITFQFVDMTNAASIESLITEKTKMLWLETPTNPIMRILDISEIVKIAKKKNIFNKTCFPINTQLFKIFSNSPFHLPQHNFSKVQRKLLEETINS